MTVHLADNDPSYIESLREFVELYDSSWEEVAVSVPESVQDELLEEENIYRTEEAGEQADTATDIREVRNEIVNQGAIRRGFTQTVLDVLSRRTEQYIAFWDKDYLRVAKVTSRPDNGQDGYGPLYGYECIVGTGITEETAQTAEPEALAVAKATTIINDHFPSATIVGVAPYDGGGVGIDIQVERQLDYDAVMDEVDALESFQEIGLARD